MKYKLVLFDFDMTLIDSLAIGQKAMKELQEKYDLNTEKITMTEIFGRTFEENAKHIAELNDNKLTWQEIMKLNISQVYKEYLDSEIVDIKTIQEIKKAGIKIGIISNSESNIIRACLANEKNKELEFDLVLGFNDKKVGETKGNLIQKAMKQLGFSEHETIYVGDHFNDILAAKKANVKCVAITTGLNKKEELAEYKPEFIIEKLSELKKIVL